MAHPVRERLMEIRARIERRKAQAAPEIQWRPTMRAAFDAAMAESQKPDAAEIYSNSDALGDLIAVVQRIAVAVFPDTADDQPPAFTAEDEAAQATYRDPVARAAAIEDGAVGGTVEAVDQIIPENFNVPLDGFTLSGLQSDGKIAGGLRLHPRTGAAVDTMTAEIVPAAVMAKYRALADMIVECRDMRTGFRFGGLDQQALSELLYEINETDTGATT